MRNSAFTQLLMGLAALSIVATAALVYRYLYTVHKMNLLASEVAARTRSRTMVNALVSDLVEYSKRDPSIDPILQSVNIKPRPTASAPSAGPKP